MAIVLAPKDRPTELAKATDRLADIAGKQNPTGIISRYDELIALLPPIDNAYNLDGLSQAETVALEAALHDGFRSFDDAPDNVAKPLPQEIRSGLLRHSFFVRGFSEYDHEKNPFEFWNGNNSDRGVPFVRFPLGFSPKRLRLYFANQLDRFCARLNSENPRHARADRWEQEAYYPLYKKPWYELHAVKFIDWIEIAKGHVAKQTSEARIAAVSWSLHCGTLGRLVEQYYWRFRYEEAAITGVGALKGASAGGKARAALHRMEHSVWQSLASEIWARRPSLSKIAVAEAIKKQQGSARTAKHIARFINHP
jgi:hypothetical protein